MRCPFAVARCSASVAAGDARRRAACSGGRLRLCTPCDAARCCVNAALLSSSCALSPAWSAAVQRHAARSIGVQVTGSAQCPRVPCAAVLQTMQARRCETQRHAVLRRTESRCRLGGMRRSPWPWTGRRLQQRAVPKVGLAATPLARPHYASSASSFTIPSCHVYIESLFAMEADDTDSSSSSPSHSRLSTAESEALPIEDGPSYDSDSLSSLSPLCRSPSQSPEPLHSTRVFIRTTALTRELQQHLSDKDLQLLIARHPVVIVAMQLAMQFPHGRLRRL